MPASMPRTVEPGARSKARGPAGGVRRPASNFAVDSPFTSRTGGAPTMRRMLKRSLLPVALLAAGTTLAACGGSDDTAEDAGSAPSTPASSAASSPASEAGSCTYTPDGSGSDVKVPPSTPAKTGEVPVTIGSTVGDLELTLNADSAPCTVNSFVSLAEQGFYDGIYCHRVGDPAEFPMLQCGDPTAT